MRTFENFLETLTELERQPNKLNTLINYVSPKVYEYISEHTTYDEAIATLKDLYDKPKNEVFARHLLATCKQDNGQSLDQYLQQLKSLAKDCNFKNVTADQYRDYAIRDAFIAGIQDGQIRQRLLEQESLDLQKTYDKARSLELAHKQSQSYQATPSSVPCGATSLPTQSEHPEKDTSTINAISNTGKCYFCGYSKHSRFRCPAKEALCKGCGKKGHFQKVCQSTPAKSKLLSAVGPQLSASTAATGTRGLKSALINVLVNGKTLMALVDTGSSESYICTEIPTKNKWKVTPSTTLVNMASTTLSKKTEGLCCVSMKYKDREYKNVKLSLLPHLCADVILGHDFLNQHSEVFIPFEGDGPPFSVCGVAAANVEAPSLFENLSPDCKPIATKSRRHSATDELFIQQEVQQLLKEGIIEPSSSPWRAQVIVTTNERHKKRLVIDYSQTVNRYTHLDAFPLPRLDKMVETISTYKKYSTLDLQSAYHQVPLKMTDKPYTAFEACGNLYQFRRIPFGVTNGVACFQRTMNNIIEKENLSCTFAYVDNVTICGNSDEEHDQNLNEFLKVASKYGITFNDSKSIIGVQTIDLFGYRISKGEIRPDPERLSPLRQLLPPSNQKCQRRIIGMFAYYSPWISHFSDKIQLLNQNTTFPLPPQVLDSFERLKSELEEAVLVTVDPNLPLVVETDASDVAISATLNQEGRPVAFFSRTLSPSEKNHSSVEKEAYAIVEAVRKWRHYLLNSHFRLITDQRSVAFIYDCQHRGKVKNDKIQRWKIELSCYNYDVIYRPGPENQAADALSRATCGANSVSNDLQEIHDSLCHPGVTRMCHFVRSRNLPHSVEEIKQMTANCSICRVIKPSFYKPPNQKLIKATQPFERLSVDFKGPLPSASQNKYILTIIDEYSRFPFAFACPDMTSSTVIKCFCQLFALFGMPSYIHSDRGMSFMSEELKSFLHSKGIATSRTTAYNPQANGQVEKLNGTLWRAITLSLKSKGLDISQWEIVLLDALHSIRSLLCTETNTTPHERIFQYSRRSTTGHSLPTWLLSPGPVYLKRNVRASKYDPLVDEVDLLDANPHYAHVRLRNGRETTVSLRQLAPVGETNVLPDINNYEQDNVEITQPEFAISPNGGEADNTNNEIVEAQDDVRQTEPLETKTVPFVRTRPYELRSGNK